MVRQVNGARPIDELEQRQIVERPHFGQRQVVPRPMSAFYHNRI